MDRWEKPLVVSAIAVAVLTWVTGGALRWVLSGLTVALVTPLWLWNVKDVLRERGGH